MARIKDGDRVVSSQRPGWIGTASIKPGQKPRGMLLVQWENKHCSWEPAKLVSVVAGDHERSADPVAKPPHYTAHPSGVECIDVAEHFSFCLGNVVKYVWRACLKGDALEDLKKAKWYLEREIANREKLKGAD